MSIRYYFDRLDNIIKSSKWYWEKRCNKIEKINKRNGVYSWINSSDIRNSLVQSGIEVKDYRIDKEKFNDYINRAKYSNREYYSYGKNSNSVEKYLEHYISVDLMKFDSDDVYIDVASCDSPMPEIINSLYGSTVYRQDLAYPQGVKNGLIGGDASRMPLPDNFATRMTLHCSYEHFEGDSDIRFIKEATRVLANGGKMCIIPLYLAPEYGIQTDPMSYADNIIFDDKANIHFAKGWGGRHSRFYSVDMFLERVIHNCSELKVTIFNIINSQDIDSSCYVKYVAIFEKAL